MRRHQVPMTKEIRLLSTSAILGYGFPEASLKAGLDRDPHVIGVDSGSVDPGPHYLGSGKPFCSPLAIRRDLRLMLHARWKRAFPWLSAPAAARAASASGPRRRHGPGHRARGRAALQDGHHPRRA